MDKREWLRREIGAWRDEGNPKANWTHPKPFTPKKGVIPPRNRRVLREGT